MPSLPYAVLLLVTMFISSFAGWRTFATSAVIGADWVIFNAAWWDISPAALSSSMGAEFSHTDIWALTDLAAMVAVVCIAPYRLWSFAIAGFLLLQIGIYGLLDAGTPWSMVTVVLDALFLAQLAVLSGKGGRRCGNSLRSVWAAFSSLLLGPHRAPCQGG